MRKVTPSAPLFYVLAIGVSLAIGLIGKGGWSELGFISFVIGSLLMGVHFELSGATAKKWLGDLRAPLGFSRHPMAMTVDGPSMVLEANPTDSGRQAQI